VSALIQLKEPSRRLETEAKLLVRVVIGGFVFPKLAKPQKLRKWRDGTMLDNLVIGHERLGGSSAGAGFYHLHTRS